VFVTYQVHVDGQGTHGGYVGDIQLQLSVPGFSGRRTSRLSVNNTPLAMHLGGSATDAIILSDN
jgi:hypothetical protein